MIKYASGDKESFKGKRVIISGSGNVAQYAALKVIELGGTVLSLSDSRGSIITTDEQGITPEHVQEVMKLKAERKQLSELAEAESFKSKTKYVDGARPWTLVEKADVALPSATQNEVSGDEGKHLIEAGVKFIAEGSNMGCTQEAVDIFEEHRKSNKGDAIWYGPGKEPCSFISPRHFSYVTDLTSPWQQARPQMPVVSRCPVSRWLRTHSESRGRPKRSTGN